MKSANYLCDYNKPSSHTEDKKFKFIDFISFFHLLFFTWNKGHRTDFFVWCNLQITWFQHHDIRIFETSWMYLLMYFISFCSYLSLSMCSAFISVVEKRKTSFIRIQYTAVNRKINIQAGVHGRKRKLFNSFEVHLFENVFRLKFIHTCGNSSVYYFIHTFFTT